ncbi:MAG: peptidylprolyl isomerase [bacterium]
MGTFENIRKISPWFFGLFAVLLVLFFTIGDNTIVDGLTGRRNQSSQEIGKVLGVKLSRTEYDKQINEVIQSQRDNGIDNQNTDQVSNDIWSRMVNKIIFEKEYEKAGIVMSNERIKDILIETPPSGLRKNFTDSTGGFMKDMYLTFITNPENYLRSNPNIQKMPAEKQQEILTQWRQYIMAYEDSIRTATPYNVYNLVVTEAASIVSPEFAKQQFSEENTTVDMLYKAYPLRSYMSAQLKVTDQELRAYYQKHKEKYIEKEDKVNIKYVVIPLRPLKSDTMKIEKRMAKVNEALASVANEIQRDSVFEMKLNEYSGRTHEYNSPVNMNAQKIAILNVMVKGQVVGPLKLADTIYYFRLDDVREGKDTIVKAKHILIRWANELKKDSAMTYAKGLIAKLKGGADFSELARLYSADQGSGQQGGEVGWFGRGRMVPQFEKASFGAPKGLIGTPVESQFGYHIIYIEDSQSKEIKFSELLFIPKISTITKNQYMMASRSVVALLEKGESCESIAKKNGYIAGETGFKPKGEPFSITSPEWISTRFFTDSAFAADKGDIIQPRTFDNCIIVAQVADKREKGDYIPLKEVAAEIQSKVLTIKQFNLAKNDAQKDYSVFQKYGSLYDAQKADSNFRITSAVNVSIAAPLEGIGRDPIFISEAMQTGLNKLTKPFKGIGGYYMVELRKKTQPTKVQIEQNFKSYMDAISRQAQASALTTWVDILRKNAELEDLRYMYYEKY